MVIGSVPSAIATSIRPAPSRQSDAASLWICQCRPSVVFECFCSRYMPTLRPPVTGSRVITDGSVMYGPPSSGQHCMIGSRSRSGSAITTSWQAPEPTIFGFESFRVRRPVAAASSTADSPFGGCSSSNTPATRSRTSSSDADAERQAHAALGAELVDQHRHRRALDVAEQQRRPARLHGAVGDLGDLEVRVDLGRDLGQLALAPQQLDPLAQVVHRAARSGAGSSAATATSHAVVSSPRPRERRSETVAISSASVVTAPRSPARQISTRPAAYR